MSDSKSSLFYDSGLRFACRAGCGACCKIPGRVEITDADALAMAGRLDMRESAFRAKFTKTDGGQLILLENDDQSCIMLGEDETCAVHPVRPLQCKTYPFWTEILANELTWLLERENCPGIDCGDPYSFEEVEYIRNGIGQVGGY